ncbi:piggyBac transposable element-derived protein 4-like [Rhinophrynus dorsalis]
MAKKYFTAEEAYKLFLESDSEEDFVFSSDSASEYVASESESSDSSDEPPVKRRQGAASASTQAQSSEADPNLDVSVQEEQDVQPPVECMDCTPAAIQTDGEHLMWTSPNNYNPQVPLFGETVGVTVDTTNFEVVDFFKMFLPDTVLQNMVTETNRYAEQYRSERTLTAHARAQSWVPTNLCEIKKFWGLTLAMGIIRKPSLHSYWDTHSIFGTPLFPSIMNRNRYQILLQFLHFNDNTTDLPRDHPLHDRLHKLRPLIDSLSSLFAKLYTPTQHISVDESLLLFKGRLVFRQYIPNKRSRYGIKFYKLCESSTGYTKFFRIYVGKDKSLEPLNCPPTLNITGKIVWDLIAPLLGRGYHLYVDNFYTGIPLFRALYRCNTLACGTINRNRKGLPRQLVAVKQKRGESSSLRCEELLVLKYTDKKNVFMLTTIHNESTVLMQQRGNAAPVPKPICIRDYNLYMGGVDRTDQVMKTYNATRKSMAWYKEVAVYLVQIAAYNSFVAFKTSMPENKLSFLDYLMQVVKSLLLETHEVPAALQPHDDLVRLRERYFISKLPPSARRRRRQKPCRVCSKTGRRRDTRYYCPKCPSQPGLCFEECFEIYHTVQNY